MSKESKISFALSFVSGFIDSAGFIALFNLFTAHVTGNLVLAGAAAFTTTEQGSILDKLLMLPVFIFGVAATFYLITYKKITINNLVLLEALFIICFALTGQYLLHPKILTNSSHIAITASFAVIGMAIQNTYMKKSLTTFTPNTVMTGNLTQFSIDFFNLIYYFLSHKKKEKNYDISSVKTSFYKVSIVLTGFLTGCFLGALFVKLTGLICCLLPAFILLWVKTQLDLIKK